MLTLALGTSVIAGISVKTQSDSKFDFRTPKTWGWDPDGAGDVKMARSADDNPQALRAQLEPVILEAVARELERRKLIAAPEGTTPDLRMHYYVLVTVGAAAQEMGQFLPSVTEWGVPPFAPQTTALSVIQTGSLVLDALSPAQGHVVWRGVAQAEIDKVRSDDDRNARVREAVRKLVERLPTKS